MKLPNFVKVLPFPFRVIYKGAAFNNFILLRKEIIKDLASNQPNPQNVGILLHELEHKKRINKMGGMKFSWKFWASRKFRFEEEIAANVPQMKHLKEHNVKFNIDKRARHLNGPIYLWCSSHEEAKTTLTKLWNKL